MRKLLNKTIFAFFILVGSFSLPQKGFCIQYSDMSSQMTPSSSMPSTGQSSPQQQQQAPGAPVKAKKVEQIPKVALPQQSKKLLDYFHPGILVYRNNKWEGNDHLLNLSRNIGVYVSLIKPEEETIDIDEDTLKREVDQIFEKANIQPTTLAYEDQPPLPAFSIEILMFPVDNGYVACCDGRLFESVKVARFILDDKMAFEAITWEKRSLIVGPKTKFKEQLVATVQEIAQAFVDRFQAYEKLNKEGSH